MLCLATGTATTLDTVPPDSRAPHRARRYICSVRSTAPEPLSALGELPSLAPRVSGTLVMRHIAPARRVRRRSS